MSEESDLAESFRTHKHIIRARLGQPHYLVPFGDIHRYSPNCSESSWLEFLRWAATKPDAHFLGMGDYLDMLSGSERRAFRVSEFHESTIETMEEIWDNLLERFAGEMKPLRGRIIGLLEGNHHVLFSDGTTSTQRLCRKLGCPYLGYTAFVRLQFAAVGKIESASKTSLTVFATHGTSSGGRSVAGGLLAPEKLEPVADADLYLMGHNHQKAALPFARLYLMENSPTGRMKVVQRKGYFIRTGSFLRSYVPDKKSYAAKKVLRPTDLGSPVVEMTMHRKGDRRKGEQQVISVELTATV